ncbi:unnamed protein product [Macrosiphum euphorbiae]|uniref:Uncharacterized protein n=1 Tax=Macrosiphum euphorbiae TaxID=13131 RepID=A0AAV0W4P2_9HEMI|nr:unnamed protein product [Macrosiphum euphorbiae]
MYASLFKSLFNKSGKKDKKELITVESGQFDITKNDVEDMLTSLNEINVDVKETLDNSVSRSVSLDNIIDGIESMPIDNTHPDYLNDSASVDNFDDTKSEVSSIGENQVACETDENSKKTNTANKINSLQCLFTWNIKSNDKKNMILLIHNKYGEYNLNISSPEFTFERYVGNLIIGYELFHKGESRIRTMKILEIGNGLKN